MRLPPPQTKEGYMSNHIGKNQVKASSNFWTEDIGRVFGCNIDQGTVLTRHGCGLLILTRNPPWIDSYEEEICNGTKEKNSINRR